MQMSHSRVELFDNCPYRFKLSYIDELTTMSSDDPTNALILGTALHEGIEKGLKHGIQKYYDGYPIINDLHVNEALKLEHWIPKVRAIVDEMTDKPMFEVEINHPTLKGFIDLLIPLGNNKFAMYDFKYSNNVDRYLESRQLHEYKHFYEELNPTHEIVKMGFIFIPKTMIRQKKTEDLREFRQRLMETLDKMEIQIKEVEFNPSKVNEFYLKVKAIVEAKEFPKNETRLCDWCEFKDFCKQGVDFMLLPKNERRSVNAASRKKLWIYGEPYSGKTTLANQFPDPVFLNTDGNITSFDAPYVPIKETLEGRQRISAWTNFKKVIDELQGGSDFKTVVVDLLEDTYEHCRRHVLDELGLTHESEGSYGKAYKMIDDEFLTVFKKLCNLDYHIVLLSHCDFSKEVTRGNGSKVTNIQPNIKEKIISKLTGYVDATGRVIVDADKGRTLNFGCSDNIVGGGRLKFTTDVIPLTYEALESLYQGTIEATEEEQPRRRRVE